MKSYILLKILEESNVSSILSSGKVEENQRQSISEVTKRIVNPKVVKNLMEKMRISGTNMWTSVPDVTTNPKEVQQVRQMINNGLLQEENDLIRFYDSRVFSIVDSHLD